MSRAPRKKRVARPAAQERAGMHANESDSDMEDMGVLAVEYKKNHGEYPALLHHDEQHRGRLTRSARRLAKREGQRKPNPAVKKALDYLASDSSRPREGEVFRVQILGGHGSRDDPHVHFKRERGRKRPLWQKYEMQAIARRISARAGNQSVQVDDRRCQAAMRQGSNSAPADALAQLLPRGSAVTANTQQINKRPMTRAVKGATVDSKGGEIPATRKQKIFRRR